MDTTEATQEDLAWMQEIPDGLFRCIYCGRYMKDKRATRVVRELGYKLHACMACYLILSISRGLSLKGKQTRVKEILRVGKPPTPGHLIIVNREGQEGLLVRP